uniref:Uncharacterized protein n=1 Tax=Plectus sambesii TaxID=2011161 RepID=A0A914W380_9BILA
MRALALVALLPCILAGNLLELSPQFAAPVHPNRPSDFYAFPPDTKTCCEEAPWIPHKLSKLDNVLYETDRKNSIVFKRLSQIIEEVNAFEATQVEVDHYIVGTKARFLTEIYQNGIKGIKGYAGVRGEHGAPGELGEQGPPGRPGQMGERGRPGNRGRPGRKGANGPPGFKGPQGKVGPPGKLDEHCKVVDGDSGEKDRDHSGEPTRFGDNNEENWKFGKERGNLKFNEGHGKRDGDEPKRFNTHDGDEPKRFNTHDGDEHKRFNSREDRGDVQFGHGKSGEEESERFGRFKRDDRRFNSEEKEGKGLHFGGGDGDDHHRFGDDSHGDDHHRFGDENSGEDLRYGHGHIHRGHDRDNDWGWGKCAAPGERGPRGPAGVAGPIGEPGPYGNDGPKGYRGRAGQKGGRGADCCSFHPTEHPWSEPEW